MNNIYSLSQQLAALSDEISPVDEQQLETVATDCFCFFIADSEVMPAEQQLSIIRQHANPNVYLKPIVLCVSDSSTALAVKVDASLNTDELAHLDTKNLHSKFHAINQWIARIPNNDNSLADNSLRFRTLRLIASRNKTCSPSPTINHKGGFEYGLVAPLYPESDGSLEHVFAFLTSQQLLKDSFVKKAHFCPHCDSAFLNFKETCPDCDSDNLERDELIHHFKCGHTDSINEFSVHNRLQCPKCHDDLKHIGVDYDKPSTISTCLNCSHTFQDPEVKADCYACHRTSDTDDLVLRRINAYKVSAIGANAAKFGLDALFTSILQTDLKLYSHTEVKQFLAVEKARIERYKKSETSLAIIHFSNLETLFNKLGRKTEQVFKEISAVFKTVFRESDLITARNESLFAVVMTETSTENAQRAIQRLTSAINALFEQSLEFELETQTATFDILNVEGLEQTIDQFISRQE